MFKRNSKEERSSFFKLRISLLLVFSELQDLLTNNITEKFKAVINMTPSLTLLRNVNGETLLHLVALSGRKECAGVLLLHGCRVSDRNYIKQTPLHWSGMRKNLDMANLLLQHDPSTINLIDQFGYTALHYASSFDHEAVVQCLLQQQSIDVNIKTNFGKMADEMTRSVFIQLLINNHRTYK